jgi:hypothetical protein
MEQHKIVKKCLNTLGPVHNVKKGNSPSSYYGTTEITMIECLRIVLNLGGVTGKQTGNDPVFVLM